MIESKEVLVENFLRLATEFESSPNPVTGIDLDDARIKLRRYLMTHEEAGDIARDLYELGKVIRKLDRPAYGDLLARIRESL